MTHEQIKVKNLKKHYQIFKKPKGLTGSIKSLVKRDYNTVKAVNGISFNIKPGELIGFIGPNGAGKTTTLKVMSGLLYPTSGKVSVLGYQPWDRNPKFQTQISLVMGQKNQLWWDLPAIETFLLNKEIYSISDDQFNTTLNQLVDLLQIKDQLNVQVRKLSLGQRMKMELAASLIHSPKILFLDEPTIGLDVVMQKKVRDFIKQYNQKHKATIILTSHYLKDVQYLCKRIMVIDQGQLRYNGPTSKIVNSIAKDLKLDKPDLEEVMRLYFSSHES